PGEDTAILAPHLNFTAPETFRGTVSDRSDVYAIGCILHYLLTATEPIVFECSHPETLSADLDAAVCKIVATATAVDSECRYENLRWLALELRQAMQGLNAPLAA
ncbi:MAG: hypothetical protein ACRD3W_04950, partial [Terriglobales bacterium]